MYNTHSAEVCLRDLTALADEFDVLLLAGHVLNSPEFFLWSGSHQENTHHYGDHGLIHHTHEVVTSCLKMQEHYPQYQIDKTELYLAALFHDYGKIRDYAFEMVDGVRVWTKTEHGRQIHHVSRSAIFWTAALDKYANDEKNRSLEHYRDSVLHAILSHHGRKEWGSPVTPSSRVAWILHLCDSLSARLYDADTLDRLL